MIRSFRPFSQNLSEKDMAKMSADLVVAATVALFFSGGTAHASVLRVAGFAHPYASIGGLGGRLREGRHCERGQCCAGSLDASTLRLRGGGGNKDIHKDNTKHTDEPVLCRYKKAGAQFEIMCFPTMVELFRESKASRDDAAVGGEVFKDIKKGDRPSQTELEAAFGTPDLTECIDIILQKGEYQLTVADRKKKTDEKTAQIVSYIVKNYMDGQNHRPIPATRVEQGIQSIKGLKIDPYKSTWFQAQDIAKKLKESLSLVKNEITATVKVGMAEAGQVSGALHSVATIIKEDFTDDGAVFEISFMSGEYDRVVADLTKATRGQYELLTERGAAGQDTLFQAAAEGGGKEATGKGKKAKAK